jgi:predicted PolB exonuclease-like 3'-5' exonuclease
MASKKKGPAYLIFDVETVPDGVLLAKTKYAAESLTPEAAIERARKEALEKSQGKSDFIAWSYCYPVAVSVARVHADFSLEAITCLDDPEFRPPEIVADFWRGLARYDSTLVSFNGRGFDLPVLEMAAFRWGIAAPEHFGEKFGRRYRYGEKHLDLADWMSNHGAVPLAGGLDLLSKLLGKPGKMETKGSDVYRLFCEGKTREINDYCMFDVLDTYFVFLRSRVLTGELGIKEEQARMKEARAWIDSQRQRHPHLAKYLKNWGDWKPWL